MFSRLGKHAYVVLWEAARAGAQATGVQFSEREAAVHLPGGGTRNEQSEQDRDHLNPPPMGNSVRAV